MFWQIWYETACIVIQVYICELGRCLLKLKDSPDPALELRMRELTIEAISLVGHRLLRNPASHKDLASGQMNQDQAAQHKLDAKFYRNLLVSRPVRLVCPLCGHCLLCLRSLVVSNAFHVCMFACIFACIHMRLVCTLPSCLGLLFVPQVRASAVSLCLL